MFTISPMQLNYVKKLIAQGESDFVEFKKTTAELQGALRTLCAFLNGKKGGVVLIGVTDDKKIVGQFVSDKTKKEIAVELNKIEPFADIVVTYFQIGADKHLIVLQTKDGQKAPYVYDGKPYIRFQSSTTKMQQERYEQLLSDRRSRNITWESSFTNDCVIADLDKVRIQQFIHTAIHEKRLTPSAEKSSIEDFLKKFHLLKNNRLANAAVVLFCKNEQKQFPQSEIKLARFKGTIKEEFLDNKQFRGNAFDLYEHAMRFLNTYLPIASKIEEGNPFRVDTPAVPQKVLREALINALCHRDYSIRHGSITIAIFDDRIEITSAGLLPSGITLEELSKQHPSHPRNRLIADIFYAGGMIEQWGRGTQEMIRICKKANLPIPFFKEAAGSFSVILPLHRPISRVDLAVGDNTYQISQRQQELLDILQEGAQSRKSLMQKMAAPPTARVVQIDLLKLKAQALVDMQGKGPSVVWSLVKK